MTGRKVVLALVCSGVTTVACVRDEAPTAPPYPVPPVAEGGEVVAKIGPVTLTTAELEKRMAGQGPVLTDRLSDADKRKEFLEQQVRFELLAQEGWARGMYGDPDVVDATKKAIVQKLLQQELDQRAETQSVSESELRAAYAKAEGDFNKPETIRLSQIVRVVEDEKDRAAERALLSKVKREILEAEKKNQLSAFGEAARAHSEDTATKNGGGELPFMTRAELEAKYGSEVARVMFEDAKIGDTVLADAENASLLMKKTGQRRAIERTLEQVKPQLRARILRDKRNEAFERFTEDLEKKHRAELDLAVLNRMKIGGKTATVTGALH